MPNVPMYEDNEEAIAVRTAFLSVIFWFDSTEKARYRFFSLKEGSKRLTWLFFFFIVYAARMS